MSDFFFVLSGTLRLFDGNQWIDAKAGDFLYVPEGGVHGFHNESDEPGSMLLLFAPGAPREGYFEAIAQKPLGVGSAMRSGMNCAGAMTISSSNGEQIQFSIEAGTGLLTRGPG